MPIGTIPYDPGVKQRLLTLLVTLVLSLAAWTSWCVLCPPVNTVHISGDASATFTSKWAVVSGPTHGPKKPGPSGSPPAEFQVAGSEVKVWVTKTAPGMFRVEGKGGSGGGGSMLEGDHVGEVMLRLGNPSSAALKLWGGNATIVLLGFLLWITMARRERRRNTAGA